MPSVISGDANVSATEFGYLDGVTSGLQSQLDAITAVANGKILQVVRATDSTNRSTNSSSLSDVTGMTVTITPTSASNAVLVIATFLPILSRATGSMDAAVMLADSSNNPISGAGDGRYSFRASMTQAAQPSVLIGYSTPATTSATTYKMRFQSNDSPNTTINIRNDLQIGQMFALEIGA